MHIYRTFLCEILYRLRCIQCKEFSRHHISCKQFAFSPFRNNIVFLIICPDFFCLKNNHIVSISNSKWYGVIRFVFRIVTLTPNHFCIILFLCQVLRKKNLFRTTKQKYRHN